MKVVCRTLCVLGFLAVLLLIATGPPVFGQCVTDGLENGPCCQLATPVLPQFPPIQQAIRFLCFRDCVPNINVQICVRFGAPIPATAGGAIVCGVYLLPTTIETCPPNVQPLWTGTLRAHYSRNWRVDAPSGLKGVWRLLLNGDLRPSPLLLQTTNPCILPPCNAAFQRVYWSGYIDYAQDCNSGAWEAAWAIGHECEYISHGPGSGRPLGAPASHPNRSYNFVGPAAGFVINTSGGPLSSGAVGLEALRKNDWTAVPNICRFEERAFQGFFTPFREFCPCVNPGGSGAFRYFETRVDVRGGCGSRTTTAGVPAGSIQFLQKIIGGWTAIGPYPGAQQVLLDYGNMNHLDNCVPGGVVSLEFYEGVETIGGYPATRYNGSPYPASLQFEDLGSSDRPNGSMLISAPHVTWFILNANPH